MKLPEYLLYISQVSTLVAYAHLNYNLRRDRGVAVVCRHEELDVRLMHKAQRQLLRFVGSASVDTTKALVQSSTDGLARDGLSNGSILLVLIQQVVGKDSSAGDEETGSGIER